MIWQVLGIIIIVIGTILFNVPFMVKNGFKRDLLAFSFFLACGAVYSILYVLGAELVTPLKFMADFSKPVTDFIMRILK